MEERIKQRLVGAAVLATLAVIFVPMLLDPGGLPRESPGLPDTPQGAAPGEFSSRVVPIGQAAPEPPGAQGQRREAALPVTPREVPEAAASRAGAPAAGAGPAAGDWVVQLGSFSNVQNAVALRDRLVGKGYAAFIRTAKGARGDITRVYVGPEPDRSGADRAVRDLEKDTRLRGIVVRNPSG